MQRGQQRGRRERGPPREAGERGTFRGHRGSIVAGGGLILLVMFASVAREISCIVSVSIKTIGEDEEGGGPKADEYTEAFGIGPLFRIAVSLEEPPDAD
jgi:hypothetical protein